MKLPEKVENLLKKPLVMRSQSTGRVHNGERLSNSPEEAKKFAEGAIVDMATSSMYQQSSATVYCGYNHDCYFDIYFMCGTSVFSVFKAYKKGHAHVFLGTVRPAELVRKERIKANSAADKKVFDPRIASGIRIYKDRSWTNIYLNDDHELMTWDQVGNQESESSYVENQRKVRIEIADADPKQRASKAGGRLPEFIMRVVDLSIVHCLMPCGSAGIGELSSESIDIIKKVFPNNGDLFKEFARKFAIESGHRPNHLATSKHLHEFLTTSLRVKSEKTLNTIADVKGAAEALFHEAAPIRRRLSGSFILLGISGDWMLALNRYYSSNVYETFAINMKTHKHFALNNHGDSMPFTIGRLIGGSTRVIITGDKEKLEKTQVGKIIEANPKQIDKRDGLVCGMTITSVDSSVLNALRNGCGTYLEQALSLDLKNILGCLLTENIVCKNKSAIFDHRKEGRDRVSRGYYWYHGDPQIYTLYAGQPSLAKAFDMPIAKVRRFNDLIEKFTTTERNYGSETKNCTIRMEELLTFFDINVGSLDDETFESVVAFSAQLGMSRNNANLSELFRELPDEERQKGGLFILRHLAKYKDFGTYRDYLRLRKEVKGLPNRGFDEHTFTVFPESERLENLHNSLVRIKTEFDNLQKSEKLKVMNEAYLNGPYKKAKKIDWDGEENDKYVIFAVANLEDLDVESNVLHHCVSSYKDAVMRGSEYIVFIRKKDARDNPYITMDIAPDWKVRQIHGKCNSNLDDMPNGKEIMDFLNRWADKKTMIKKETLSGHYGALCHM